MISVTLKTLVLSVLFFLSTCVLNAQNCEPDERIEDEFSGVVYDFYGSSMGSSRSLIYGYSFYVSMYVMEDEGIPYFSVWLNYYQGQNDASINDFQIPEGSQIRIKTTGGLQEFSVQEVLTQKRNAGSGKVLNMFRMYSPISEEQLQHFQNYQIEKYQIVPTGKEPFSDDVSHGKAEDFQAQIQCYLTGSSSGMDNTTSVPARSGVRTDGRHLEEENQYVEVALGLAYFGGSGRYEYFVSDNFTIGASMGYVVGEEGGADVSAFHIAPMIRYYVYTKNNLGVYLGMSLGYARAKASGILYRGFPYYDYTYVETTAQGLYYDFNIGVKGRIADPIFILGEIGYAPDGSVIRAGIALEL